MRYAALFTLGVAIAAPAVAQVVVTVGTNDARRCYLAAEARLTTSDARTACDLAIASRADLGPVLVASHVNRGVLRTVDRDLTGALADFDAALSLDPDAPEAWLNKGAALLRMGRSAEAIAAFDAAIDKRVPRPALAYLGRAYAHEDTGAMSAAYRDLRQAAALSPGWAAPRRELRRYRVRAAGGGAAAGH